jgi:uncharacterized protein
MKALTETERQEFLAKNHVAVLSVATTDGRPPASVPIWYGYRPGGNIQINTGASARKAKLETTTPTPVEVQEAIAIRYLGEERGRNFVDSLDGHESVLFTIRPDRWLTADFSGEL